MMMTCDAAAKMQQQQKQRNSFNRVVAVTKHGATLCPCLLTSILKANSSILQRGGTAVAVLVSSITMWNVTVLCMLIITAADTATAVAVVLVEPLGSLQQDH